VRLLAENGFRGTTVAGLADRIGMTAPGLLYYFGTKDRLLLDVLVERERVEREFYASQDRGLASLASTPLVAENNVREAVFARLYVVLAAESLNDGDPLHEFFVDRYERTRRFVARAVEADKERGRVRVDVDVAHVAREVISVMMGAELQWLMDPDRFEYLATIEIYTAELVARLAP